MRRIGLFVFSLALLSYFVVDLSAQVCTLSVMGVNQSRSVVGPVDEECGWDLHTAPFGNWGVTSNMGNKQDGHQFDGWCHDTLVCDNNGSCRTKCGDGWYEWNSCTVRSTFAAPNCTLYNSETCGEQLTTQGINLYGLTYVDVPTNCPLDIDGDSFCDTGGCKDIASYSNEGNFMSIYELDPWDRDDLVQTLYFPAATVPLSCHSWGCDASASPWLTPVFYASPSWPPKINTEIAIVVSWGWFQDRNQFCRNMSFWDSRYNCY